jgi:hypothetical protein
MVEKKISDNTYMAFVSCLHPCSQPIVIERQLVGQRYAIMLRSLYLYFEPVANPARHSRSLTPAPGTRTIPVFATLALPDIMSVHSKTVKKSLGGL